MSAYLPPSLDTDKFSAENFKSSLTLAEMEMEIKRMKRLLVRSGKNVDGTATGTQSFGVTFVSAPVVVSTIESDISTHDASIVVHNVTTIGFSYIKYSQGHSMDSAPFYWLANGVVV
tara:strand:+ start:1403 stop:1753 length:351 start_codon:yes stop_codon:yes gene_type:complete